MELEGIPFYLPKPLLIVSKNFHYVEEPKVGLTDSAPIPTGFDDQAKYADVNARTNFTTGTTTPSPAGKASGAGIASAPHLHSTDGPPISPQDVPSDGLSPQTFYTYQVVFIPDMTQKYGLKIRGGPGEVRAAMNLVNGWQFTGLGPYYMKDSSSAQNILSSGIFANLAATGVADVIQSTAGLAGQLQTGPGTIPAEHPAVQQFSKSIQSLDLEMKPMTLPDFAEIRVYEPQVTPDGRMEWLEIVSLSFDRQAIGYEKSVKAGPASQAPAPVPAPAPPATSARGGLQSGAVDPQIARSVVAGVLGIPPGSPALRGGGPPAGPAPAGSGAPKPPSRKKHGKWFPFFGHKADRPRIIQRSVLGELPALRAPQPPQGTPVEKGPGGEQAAGGSGNSGDQPVGNR